MKVKRWTVRFYLYGHRVWIGANGCADQGRRIEGVYLKSKRLLTCNHDVARAWKKALVAKGFAASIVQVSTEMDPELVKLFYAGSCRAC